MDPKRSKIFSFLFFQGEDGIRDVHVTAVQTCALPISRGSFEVLVPTGGRPERVRVLEPGDLFGEVGFFDGLPRSADVVALEASEALVLTQAAFQRLRLTHPRLALRFVLDLGRILGERFRASDALAGDTQR